MPLNQAEKVQVAQAFLKCFETDSGMCGRTLKFVSQFTAGQTNLLSTVQAEALTWAPFAQQGLDVAWWNSDVERVYNLTITT